MTATDSTNRIWQYLDEHGTPFRVINHPAAASADKYHETLGTRYEQQAKSLFVSGVGTPRPTRESARGVGRRACR
jgi:hypothetical protein